MPSHFKITFETIRENVTQWITKFMRFEKEDTGSINNILSNQNYSIFFSKSNATTIAFLDYFEYHSIVFDISSD